MKRIFKYATGDAPPEGAIYLSTVTQTLQPHQPAIDPWWEQCWLVWHYFLVETDH